MCFGSKESEQEVSFTTLQDTIGSKFEEPHAAIVSDQEVTLIDPQTWYFCDWVDKSLNIDKEKLESYSWYWELFLPGQEDSAMGQSLPIPDD